MRRLFFIAVCLAAVNAFAQTEIFDADDSVDPRLLAGRALFISRVSIGAAAGYGDQYRPLHQTMGFLHFSNTLYWHGLQATYKHTEIRGSDDWSQRNQPQSASFPSTDQIANLSGRRPVAQIHLNLDQSLDAPPPGPKDSLQVAWYHAFGPSAPMLRYRFTWGRQHVEPVPGLKNAEDEDLYYRVEVQTMIRLGGKSIFGDVNVSTITQRGTPQQSQQRAITYTARLPLLRVGHALVAPSIAVGHVSGGAVISVANPSVDFVWSRGSDLNFHVSYSPYLRNAGNGWTARSQIALYADRAIYAKLFGTHD
ncbi:MAG TPA: hypothetical protein VHX14_16705 [Thermoanaerobaculia bacterium]|jgi:hypothetical protein|nr:hypothetical protein [Thermoanaerobaculia bacterium]